MYYVVYGLLYLFSMLPMWLLYIISDIISFILFKIIGYRVKVVRANLQTAFPEKSLDEIKAIEKRFFRNFTDNFIETLKMFSGGPAWADRHFKSDNTLFNELYGRGLNVQVHLGHNFNWELTNVAIAQHLKFVPLMIYMPLNNKVFEKIMFRLRSSSGSVLLSAKNISKEILPYRNSNNQFLLGLVADQVPGKIRFAYWANFFGKKTPFARGPEKHAREHGTAVVFAAIYKIKRGYYKMEYHLETADPSSYSEGEITLKYVRFLEEAIRRNPENWLWTHRRWKRTWSEEYKENTLD